MKYLADTHIVLWWLTEPSKLSKKSREIIQDRSQQIFVSSVSFWEMAIKSSLGRIEIPRNILTLLKNDGFDILPLYPEASLSVVDLPVIHQDPFDRMLIAQAKYHDKILITRDNLITKYPVVTLKG